MRDLNEAHGIEKLEKQISQHFKYKFIRILFKIICASVPGFYLFKRITI